MLKKSWKLLLCMCLVLSTVYSGEVQAKEVGKIYKTSVTGYYYHPVTGAVEDNTAEENYAIGESMVKNIVQSAGQYEVTNGGTNYFTFRLGMQNFSSSVSFQIQNKGSSGWSSVSSSVTGTGSLNSGTTKDYMVKAPSQSCVVRVSMYVEPMGRTVTFYLGHGSLSESSSTGMSATKVTTEVASTTTSDSTTSSSNSDSTTSSPNSDSTTSSPNSDSASSSNGTSNTSEVKTADETTATTEEVEKVEKVEEVEEVEEAGELEEEEITEEPEEEVEEVIEEDVTTSSTPWGPLACALLAAVIGGLVAFKMKKSKAGEVVTQESPEESDAPESEVTEEVVTQEPTEESEQEEANEEDNQ